MNQSKFYAAPLVGQISIGADTRTASWPETP